MTPEHNERRAGQERRARELFDEALDLPVEERDEFLENACGADLALLVDVSGLVRAADPEDDVLELPAVHQMSTGDADLHDLENLEGEELGSYRLTRLIGTGGMGVVYLAERTGPTEGKVAVKLIKKGMDSAVVAGRFRYERQVLARLTHPNIAHFIDGGVTEKGRAYFVMEYVPGESIVRYANRLELNVEARVRLFLQVLEAVSFAHQNLIVHRDIKPSNILVAESGHPKLLDFGVAKVLAVGDEAGVTLTRLGGRVMTPSYSSPEQIRGEPVTTAADVYSLGVVLYELFAGQRPFELDTVPFSELPQLVGQRTPTKPSSMAPLEAEGVRADRFKRLRKDVAGDLDTIVLKALRTEPERRYSSAREFHDDLCRYLDGRPVTARPATFAYRSGKFISRHRTAAVAVLAFSVASGVGGWSVLNQRVATQRQAFLAEQRVRDVRSLVNTLLFEIHDEVAALPGSTGARKLILDRAYEQLGSVQEAAMGDPDLLLSLAGAYRRLGDVEGNPSGPSLGDLASARVAFVEGLRLATLAVEMDPDALLRTRSLGLLHERYGGVLASSGDVEEGVGQLEAALAVYQRIATAYPDSSRHQLTYVIGVINLADMVGHPLYPNLGRASEATGGYRHAMRLLELGVLRGDLSRNVVRYRGLVQERLGRMFRESGNYAEALVAGGASLAVRQALFAEHPGNDDIHRDVGVSLQNVCSVQVLLERFQEAKQSCDLAEEVFQDRFRVDSLNAGNLTDMSLVNRSYEELYRASGDTAKALEHLALVVRWSERRLALDPTFLLGRLNKATALLTRATIQDVQGQYVEGWEATRVFVEALREGGHLSEFDENLFERLLASVAGSSE